MKYLLIFALVMVVVWLWRAGRQSVDTHVNSPAGRELNPAQPVTEIVACDLCHVHLPRTEALTGPDGVYCSLAHRRQADR
ncbi:MAG: hypothetical protein JWP47_3082 [Polaromonas sp.]|jgi:uncharacterized protein|nr:hypothetical protein [Polaromonas sp.]